MIRFAWILVCLSVCLPVRAGAAERPSVSLRLIGPAGLIRSGEILTVELQLDSRGQRINAAEIGLRYPTDRLEVRYVGRENSIFSLWPTPPEWTDSPGLVTMSAGRPGGLYALNASVATVYFRVLQSGPVRLMLDPDRTAAYLNDGQGTRLPVDPADLDLEIASDLVPGITLVSITHPTPTYWSHGRTVHVGWTVDPDTEYSYRFDTDPTALPDDTPKSELGSIEYTNLSDGTYYFTIKQRQRGGPWSSVTQRRFLNDATPPDPFELKLLPASAVAGANVLAWSAVDTTSGVAGAVLQVDGETHTSAVSPVTAEPGWHGRVATVVVTDAAGNKTSASLHLPGSGLFPTLGWWLFGLGLGSAAAAAGWKFGHRRSPRT
jgi:hypothetical protein